jgi:hypothetical protein
LGIFGGLWIVNFWDILQPFGAFCRHLGHLVYFCGCLVYFKRSGVLNRGKSGNPGSIPTRHGQSLNKGLCGQFFKRGLGRKFAKFFFTVDKKTFKNCHLVSKIP